MSVSESRVMPWLAPRALLLSMAVAACTGDIADTGGITADVSASTPTRPPTPGGSTSTPEFGPLPPGASCAGIPADPGPSLVRRLTSWEYANTIRDTLGVDVIADVGRTWPTDPLGVFSNDGVALIPSLELVQATAKLAEAVTSKIDSAFVTRFTDCQNYDSRCETQLVRNLGLAMFRRTPDDEVVGRYRAILAVAGQAGDPFAVGAQMVLRAMLQSPRFLYRIEEQTGTSGRTRQVDAYEMASRLSYLVWGSVPDTALYDAARTGALKTADQIRAQVRRMIADRRAREQSRRFVHDWLRLWKAPAQFDDALGTKLVDETLAVAERVHWDDRTPINTLLTAPFTVADQQVAEYYRLPNPRSGVQTYDLSASTERRGILTHASLLAGSGGADASMVYRGQFLLNILFCRGVPPPPPGVDTMQGEILPDRSRRYYSDIRLQNGTCGGCHGQFEPLAHAFEPYDALGRYMPKDEKGNTTRSDGVARLPDGQEITFRNTQEMAELVAKNASAKECMTRRPLEFALGRLLGDTATDTCGLEDLVRRTWDGGGTYEALLTAIATQPSFQLVRVEAL